MTTSQDPEKKEERGVSRRKFVVGAGATLAIPIFFSEALAKLSKRKRKKIELAVEDACAEFDAATEVQDLDRMSRILADDATYLDFDGSVKNKQQILDFNSKMQDAGMYGLLERGAMSVHVIDADMAQLIAEIGVKGDRVNDVIGRNIAGSYRILHLFVKRGDSWKLLSGQVIRLSEA
jgi:ketosteroid isomerase-like protein